MEDVVDYDVLPYGTDGLFATDGSNASLGKFATETTSLLPRPSEGWYSATASAGGAGGTHEHIRDGRCLSVYAPPSPRDAQGRGPNPQLLRYDARYAASALSLLQLRGTAFASWSIWLHGFANVAVACATCALVFFGCRRPELIDTERVAEAVSYSSALLALLLTMYLSTAVRRWWAMRVDTLGGLSGAIGDLSLLLAAHLPHADSGPLKALVRRYSLASLELTFMQAQGTDGVLGGLVHQRLLTGEEKRKLEELVSKPQAMWVWIAGIFQRLAERGKLSSRMLVLFYGICTRARGAVGRGRGAFTYLDSQIPYPYVHLLSVLVHLNNLAIAAKCGVFAAVALWNLQRPEAKGDPVSDAESFQVLVLQVLLVIFAPALYHAMLEEAARLSDPFADKFEDFPRRACHIWMRTECEALEDAGCDPPLEALEVTQLFEVQKGDVVQDRVAAVAEV